MDEQNESPTQTKPHPHPQQQPAESPGATGVAEADKPKTIRAGTIISEARRGNTDTLPYLEKVFDKHPDFLRAAGDLTRMTEQMWLDRICGADLVAGQAIRRRVEQLKKDLAGPEPSSIDQLLVERIVVCWLAAEHADLMLASLGVDAAGTKVAQFWSKQAETMSRRYLAAVKMLATVRRLAGGLRIEINHNHNTAGAAAPDGDGQLDEMPLTERLKDLIRDDGQAVAAR